MMRRPVASRHGRWPWARAGARTTDAQETPRNQARATAQDVVRRVQEGSLYVLLFLLPFSKAAIEVTFGLLLLTWLCLRPDPITRMRTLWAQRSLRPVVFGVGIFLVFAVISIVVSDYPAQSLQGFVRKWMEYLMFFVIAAEMGQRPGVLRRCLIVLACSALFVVSEGVIQEVFGQGLFRGYALKTFARMTGPYENPIDLATYFMVMVPIVMGCAVIHRGKLRWAYWGLLVLMVCCMARTIALGAWLGLFSGLAILLLTRRNALRRYSLMILVGSLLVGGMVLHRTNQLGQALSLSDIGKTDRLVMWQAAMGMIRDRPLLGHGLNTFMANYLDYWVGGERQPRYAHNCVLQMAAEIGVLGAAGFVWLLGAIIMFLMRSTRQHATIEQRTLVYGLAAGLTAFIAQSVIDTNFYSLRQAALFWTLAGLAVGYASLQDVRDPVRVPGQLSNGRRPMLRAPIGESR